MRLLYLILRLDTLWGRSILILLLFLTLFFLPAAVIHRYKILRMIAQRKPIVVTLFLFLMVLLIVQIDSNLIASYYFAEKYGWEIYEVRSVREVIFKDETLLNKNNTQSLSKENELQEYPINDPRDMSALICSDTIGLTYDQIVNRRLKLYSLAVKDDISFSHDGKLFTPDIELMVGFFNNEIVFGALFIRSQFGSGYYPVNFNEESIKEEISKVCDNRFYAPVYGDVRISFLPGGYQLYHYPYQTCIIFPSANVNPETLNPIIPAEIVKVGFDNRYIIAWQNEYTTDLRIPDIPLYKYYILDTKGKIVYKYDTLEEFENQCRQLRIDNIEFQAVDSFAVRSYARLRIGDSGRKHLTEQYNAPKA